MKFRLLYLIGWYLLSSSLSVAQDRNEHVRELNQVMECMNQFSFCSLTWVTDATQLQDAFQVCKKEIYPNYFYTSKTRSGKISWSGISENFHFPELTPTPDGFLPVYQSDFIPWLKSKAAVLKLLNNPKSAVQAVKEPLLIYLQTVDSLYVSHIELLDYVSEKVYLTDNEFQKGKQILIDQDHLFHASRKAGNELISALESVYRAHYKPNETHAELRRGLQEINGSTQLLDQWEEDVYNENTGVDLENNDQIRVLAAEALSKDSLYFYNTRGYNNQGSGFWLHTRYDLFYKTMESTIFWYGKSRFIPERQKTMRQIRHTRYLMSYNQLMDQHNRYVAIADGLNYAEYASCCMLKSEVDNNENVLLQKCRRQYIFDYIPDEIPVAQHTETVTTETKGEVATHAQLIQRALPHHLLYLLDVSSSMNEGNKWTQLKEGVNYLIELQRSSDHVSLVRFASHADVVLQNIPCDQKKQITHQINELKASGSTNFLNGLEKANELFKTTMLANGINAGVIFSDGEFPITEKIEELVHTLTKRSIQLHFIYLGPGLKKKKAQTMTKLYTQLGVKFHDYNERDLKDILVEIASE